MVCNQRERSMGRKKIPIEKINNSSSLQVTFSKRRNGLFKKASELCFLGGAEISIIVFSPAGKPFSYGHPCVESVMNRFLNSHQLNPLLLDNNNGSTTSVISVEHQEQYKEVVRKLEEEKKRGERIKELRKKGGLGQFWWEAPIDEMGLGELEEMRVAIEEMKKKVEKKADELLVRGFLAENTLDDVFDHNESFLGQTTLFNSRQ